MDLPKNYIAPENMIYDMLDTVGDGSGSMDANVNGSVTPVEFKIKPPAGEIFQLDRMIVHIETAGVLSTGKYGSVNLLANGVKCYVGPAGSRIQIPKGFAIQSHDDWAAVCHDSMALNYGSTAGKAISIRWSFYKSGRPFFLDGDKSEEFVVQVNDDLTGLSHHLFLMNGIKYSK